MLLVHLSDLHFGTEENRIVNALAATIRDIAPDLVVVSGDFTQIADDDEFRNAKAFLDTLERPTFCVPGNHDVPGFNLLERLRHPYKRYKEFIAEDLCPIVSSEYAIIAGLNTARRALPHWNWANGAISETQLAHLRDVFKPNDKRWRICVFHHPIHKVHEMPLDVTVFGGDKALKAMHELKIDMVLTGHVHHASITTRGDAQHQTVYVSASTALSSRIRGQENGFNVVSVVDDQLRIDVYKYRSGSFLKVESFAERRFIAA
jgi:3',5'-cyclic AMP phosphodiesterase CpdA